METTDSLCFLGIAHETGRSAEHMRAYLAATRSQPLARLKPVIWVTADMQPDPQRFRIAHELCEVLLWRHGLRQQIPADMSDRDRDPILQAGASALLTPGELFEPDGRVSDWDLAYLRTVFNVSWEAIVRRLPSPHSRPSPAWARRPCHMGLVYRPCKTTLAAPEHCPTELSGLCSLGTRQ